ncbi:protein-export chaperone SecB [Maricaulis sp. MIT060901]|uniref:protein-export chaperone SecB n=1 Tax=Maricaulis sp. MIT060901 TaxID=3096993 RepID=UPI003999D204
MADAPNTPAEGEMPKAPSLRILTQFIKDLSFENPSYTDSARSSKPPNIDLGIDVQARTISPDTYEVTLNFSARAAGENDEVVFIAELAYAGLFQMANIADADREPFLLIECPRMIFPFARRILADVTRDGGFPPLMLDPVDFANLYRAQLAKRAAAAPGADTNGNGEPAAAN